MDLPLYLLLGVLILALIIGGPLLRSRSKRRAAQDGEHTGNRYAAARLAETLDVLGTPLVIHAPEPLAREILASATVTAREECTIREDGGYGIRFAEPDDTIVRLVADPEGTRMQVETFREYLGFPQTAQPWTDLRSRVASIADAHGVTVGDGATIGYRRGPLLDDRNARWERDA